MMSAQLSSLLSHSQHRAFVQGLVLSAAAALLVAWSFAVPIFESPDEGAHWQYARYLNAHWRLPIYGSDFVEANSPPLYYALIAPFAIRSETPTVLLWYDALDRLVVPSPPRVYQNANTDFEQYWPLRLARLVTVTMSVMTIVFCFLAGKEATGKRTTGYLTAGMTLLLPEFSFRGTSISNDALVATLCAAFLYVIIRIVNRGYSLRLGVLAAILMASAFLAKISAVFTVLIFAVALLDRKLSVRSYIYRLSPLLIAVVIVSPWLLRNLMLYGDIFASRAMIAAVSDLVDKKAITSTYFYTTFPNALIASFIGVFGMMNFYLPDYVYRFFKIYMGMAALGCLALFVVGKVNRRIVIILLATIILNLAIVININLTFTQPQGRYLFPALPAIALLTTLGIEMLPIKAVISTSIILLAFAALNIYILTNILIPAYWPSPFRMSSGQDVFLKSHDIQNYYSDLKDNYNTVQPLKSEFTIEYEIKATDFNFLRFDILGSAMDQNQVGSVAFLAQEGSRTSSALIPFEWISDGQRRIVTIPLFSEERWRGQIIHLKILLYPQKHDAKENPAGIGFVRLSDRLYR